ncbi:TF2B [Enterospora canceri]|uniref:Transcription initiation factor IIB n=1 Tax=Enterospora canceri TaxID=1081671 RepID=A0A1Y1S705_9MICR|nr:TF2B [Enterospora canceri]
MNPAIKYNNALNKCQECGETRKIIEDYRNGFFVCGRCGCVFKDRVIDEGSEWRSFSDSAKPDPCRVGSATNPFLDSEQLDTVITAGSGANSYTLNKIQMKNYMRGPDRVLKNGFATIQGFCERGSLNNKVMDSAQTVFKEVESKKLLKGKNLEGSIGACIYIACKTQGCPRTFKEIAVITTVPKKEIGKCYKLISREIDTSGVVPNADIVGRFCSDMNLGIKIQKTARHIAAAVQEIGCLAGRSPDSVASAVIYFTLYLYPERVSNQKDIQFITNVTDVTIKSTYKDLLLYRHEIVPEEFQEAAEMLPRA